MAKASLIETVYLGIKQELSNGTLLPGQRVDITALCERYGASKSPVRNVLNRLVGEGLLEVQAHDGFYRPRVTEQKLRDLYMWNQQVLLLALENAFALDAVPAASAIDPTDDDLVTRTETLFVAVAKLGGNSELRRAIESINDRLRPIRRQKDGVFLGRPAELAGLTDAWLTADMPALKQQILTYHQVRLDLVPQIVAIAYRERGDGADPARH